MFTSKTIAENIQALRRWLKENKVDGFYVSSTDPYLNEYVPLENCHRYYFSGFTGSTASLLVTREKVYLYVDGRYHEQADKEVDHEHISVMKTPMTKSNNSFLMETAEQLGLSTIGYEADRTPRFLEESFEQKFKCVSFDLSKIISFAQIPAQKEVYHLKAEFRGEDTLEKLERVMNAGEAYFISALDSIAWLSNCRGFHLPHQSTFLSRAFATREKLFVFVDHHCPLCSSVFSIPGVEFIAANNTEIVEKLKSVAKEFSLDSVYFDSASLTAFDYRMLKNVFGELLVPQKNSILFYQSVKTDKEVKVIRESFDRANAAIWSTINRTKEIVGSGEKFTELDFYQLANDVYREGGCR